MDLDFVAIPGAEFHMGSSAEDIDRCVAYWETRLVDQSYRASFRDWIRKEYPHHRIRVDRFHISRFPVTNGEYEVFMQSTARPAPESIAAGSSADHPVWGVSYEEAEAYAQWLGQKTGAACRLPREAEWECAARGPASTEYPFGDLFDGTKCNTIEAGLNTTTPVDHYPDGASGYGVCDLAGNVEEWTSSFYSPYPGGAFIEDDISALAGRRYRVLRGGSFALGGDLARCARRHGPHPAGRFRFRGFRVVMT